MKKLYLILLIFLFFLQNGFTQSLINNHWQLGQVDLNFTGLNPTASTVTNGNYGFATISDTSGQLLFYTNGKTVWNKNHAIMTNGSILETGLDDILNTIIVPNPSNINQYYIFTSYNPSCLCSYLKPTKYVYSIVEFNISNPLGTVLNIGNTYLFDGATVFTNFLKDANGNDLAAPFYFGSLTYTKTNDGSNFWVVAQYGNKMLSYKVDGLGFNQVPVESTFPSNQIYSPGSWNISIEKVDRIQGAKIKFANNNLFLVGLQYSRESPEDPANSTGYFYKVNFNSTSGIFSNYQQFTNTGKNIYEFEISNNSSNLYFIRKKYLTIGQTGDSQVIVKDLNNDSTPIRILNENSTLIPSSQFSYIQKDRNGNILLSSVFTANNRNKYIHKIENQDLFNSSLVNVNFVYLNDKSIHRLPQLIPEIMQESCQSLTLNTEPNIAYTYIDYSSITAGTNYNLNQQNQDIKMFAEEYILLKPNTHIAVYNKYLAKIQNCTNEASKTSGIDYKNDEDKINYSNKKSYLFPNPSNSKVNILMNEYKLNGLTITSIDGKEVFRKKIEETNSYQLDVSSFSNGIYIINITTFEGVNFTEKLIKN